jgi:hypothetical protein
MADNSRQITMENSHGVRYQVGQQFTLARRFSNTEEIVRIISITDSGKFFKVSGNVKKSFSIETLHSIGTTITNGYYLSPRFNREKISVLERQTGKVLQICSTLTEAIETVCKYEKRDVSDRIFMVDFYQIQITKN